LQKKIYILFFLAGICAKFSLAQEDSTSQRIVDSLNVTELQKWRTEFGHHKEFPAQYELQILAALSHFPELKSTGIKFRLHSSHASLKTRINFWTFFNQRENRRYTITISTKSVEKMEPLLLGKLPEKAKVGVLGHELSHVSDFSKKSMFQCIGVGFGHLSQTYIDSLEFNTDRICIRHGLGNELEAWSSFIRKTMKVENWRGSDFVNKPESYVERYMNPDTIRREMDSLNAPQNSH